MMDAKAASAMLFPAQAGINRTSFKIRKPSASVPRTGGDKPDIPAARYPELCLFPAQAGINRPPTARPA